MIFSIILIIGIYLLLPASFLYSLWTVQSLYRKSDEGPR
jgi:hypothetical protein